MVYGTEEKGGKKAHYKEKQGRQEEEKPEKANSNHNPAVKRKKGKKENFDLDRMTATTSRSGIPFLMTRDIAKGISKQIRSEAKGRSKKTVTAGRVRNMIADELRNRNQQAAASSYIGEMPENTQRDKTNVEPYESPIGSADKDQHNTYRADRDSVLHDRSKRLSSSA